MLPRTTTTTVNAVQTFSLYETGDPMGNYFLDPYQPGSYDYLVETFSSDPTGVATYTLLGNGSLVILYPDAENPASNAGRIAVQYPGDGDSIFFVDGGYPNASYLTCEITTDVDGTCPFTCSVSGANAGSVFYDVSIEAIVSIGARTFRQHTARSICCRICSRDGRHYREAARRSYLSITVECSQTTLDGTDESHVVEFSCAWDAETRSTSGSLSI